MMKERQQVLDLFLIQIHSAHADPLRRGRATQHNSWDVGGESFSERTQSPKAVTDLTWTRLCRNCESCTPVDMVFNYSPWQETR